tara:strand:- start:1586 stop:2806 length:1221 start_codon:yes stop_codon:yes gene_type:complete
MSIYRFNSNDVYVNTVKLNPSIKFVVYSGSSYYNNVPNISGAFADPIRLTDSGHVSLYELNIDRTASVTGRTIGGEAPDTGLIYPWVVKNGSRIAFRTTDSAVFNSSSYGSLVTSSYPLVSSITKEFWSSTDPRFDANPVYVSADNMTGSVSHILALKNTINNYAYINPQFQYSSSARDFNNIDLGLVSIPTVFYGSQIAKGTIDLNFYFTGTLIGRAQDTNHDGVLYETYGANAGAPIGLALYNEGFLILTGAHALSAEQDNYTGSLDNPRWIYFAQSISGSITAPRSTFIMEMSGTTRVQTLTMFATAPKGQLNQSNNPTFVEFSTADYAATGSKTYLENNKQVIKNIVSSSFPDPTGSFEKTTYISKIGVYDDRQNLIGIAKVATPVKKTVERDFTFKIKLDL